MRTLILTGLVALLVLQGTTAYTTPVQMENYSRSGKDSSHAAIEYLGQVKDELLFRATYTNKGRNKSTLFVRDQEGELVFEDQHKKAHIRKVYRIPVRAASVLTFEWVEPRTILLSRFRVEAIAREEVIVVKL